MKKTISYEKMIEKYIYFLKNNNFSINTIKTYNSFLNMYVNELINISSLKKKIKERFNSPNTAWVHYNVISSFLKWKKDKRKESFKQLKLPAISKQYMCIFNKKYLVRKTTIVEGETTKNIKKITIRFLFETGIRATELKNIICFQKDTLKVLGKGNKIRDVFCTSKTLKLFKEINFLYTTKTLRLWVKEILGGVFTPHSIRRSHATHLLLKGASPKMVMLQLGHEKIETTFRYLQLSYETNKKIYNKYF